MLGAFEAFHMDVMAILRHNGVDDRIDFDSIWNATFDAMTDVNQILASLQLNHVLYETYAFRDLFFGDDGIITRQGAAGAANATAPAAAANATDASAAAPVDATAAAPVDATAAAPADATVAAPAGGRRFLQDAAAAPVDATTTSAPVDASAAAAAPVDSSSAAMPGFVQ